MKKPLLRLEVAPLLFLVDLSDETKELEITTDRFGFYRFVSDAAEQRFKKKLMRQMPRLAGSVWLVYAAFAFLVLQVTIIDLRGPYASSGVFLLVLAVLSSTGLAFVPRFLDEKRMAVVSIPWSMVGVFVPLLTVFGCALSRPTVVGNDIRIHLAFGAFMRSYSFADARLQAIGVPLFALMGTLQYFVPGAHDDLNDIPVVWILILGTVVAARNREGSQHENYRRGHLAKRVLQQIEEVTRVQEGLLRSSMPGCVFDAAAFAGFKGLSSVHQGLAVVMVVRAAAPVLQRKGATPAVHFGVGHVLDRVFSSTYLSTAGVMGDDAVIVGPVPTAEEEMGLGEEVQEESLHEALLLAKSITESKDGSPKSTTKTASALSVLIDQDTVAHVVELGSRPRYTLLGVSATRLICVGFDISGMVRGLLVTDRVATMVRTSGMLGDVELETQAPMTVRGQGVMRWSRIVAK